MKCIADNVRNKIYFTETKRNVSSYVSRASCCRFQDGDCIANNFLLKVNVRGKSENDADSWIRKQGILSFKDKLKNPALQSTRRALVKRSRVWGRVVGTIERMALISLYQIALVIGFYAILWGSVIRYSYQVGFFFSCRHNKLYPIRCRHCRHGKGILRYNQVK